MREKGEGREGGRGIDVTRMHQLPRYLPHLNGLLRGEGIGVQSLPHNMNGGFIHEWRVPELFSCDLPRGRREEMDVFL